MAFSEEYQKQVRLLMRVLPFIAKEDCFALKGGTAINFFVRDMPRLSVDIDLTYLPIAPRPKSLAGIGDALRRIAGRIREGIPSCHITERQTEGTVTKLFVQSEVQTKIEVTPVIRGCAYGFDTQSVSEAVEEAFGFAEIQTVSFADLYGGKIVAALDRQHPRDLFDVRDLLANEGINDDLRRAFVVYLLSHDRPMGEVLGSKQKDISAEYERGFRGMTAEDVPLADLLAAREALVEQIVGEMPEGHREFLISFERGEPKWNLLGVTGANQLPAVKWRQINLGKISKQKRDALVAQLETVLSSRPPEKPQEVSSAMA
jgi:predicted nucleotidyltransferase component of viral defense system